LKLFLVRAFLKERKLAMRRRISTVRVRRDILIIGSNSGGEPGLRFLVLDSGEASLHVV
jgi:hypothetical protein